MTSLFNDAERALKNLKLDILEQSELDDWYAESIKFEPCSPISESWEEFSGYCRKVIYLRSYDNETLANVKFAYYYPDGTTETSQSVIVIEDD
jgi:hypothetical protein